ncbi:MAG: hypothetical protein U0835_13670 [Isosphaeraceae bacterium]
MYDDGRTVVHDSRLIDLPARPTLICTQGWRGGWHGRNELFVGRTCGFAAYVPSAESETVFTLEARAFHTARNVRLTEGGRELARWRIPTGKAESFQSPPIRLGAGLHHLALESDGEEPASHDLEAPTPTDRRPYSLVVRGVSLAPADPVPAVALGK